MSRETKTGGTRRRFLSTAAGWGIGSLALVGGAALASGPDLNRLKRQVAEADLAGPAQLSSPDPDTDFACDSCQTGCQPSCQSCPGTCQSAEVGC
jgi:hypothetical protein